jgi:hypothetical protein
MQNDGTLAIKCEPDNDTEPGTNASALEEAKALTRKRMKLIAWLIEQRDEAIEGLRELGHVEPEPKKGRPEGAKDKGPRKPRGKAPEVQPQ